MDYRFLMKRIQILQFAILRPDFPEEGISLSTELNFGISSEAPMIGCKAKFRFRHGEEDMIILEVECDYEIHADDWMKMAENRTTPVIPVSLLETLAMHTIGTARGILFCRTEGTRFNNLIIPPIDVKSLMGKGSDDN